MAITIRIKRRWSGTAEAPTTLKSGEIAYNGVNDVLYIGYGDDGAGNATSVKSIAGFGASMMLTSDQVVSGIKTFNSSPLAPTPSFGDNSTKVATTAFVAAAITAASIPDGDKGDITVASSGSSWTIDADVVTNAKLANMATGTLKGRASAGTGDPEDLTPTQVKSLLALDNVDNTADVDKPVSTPQQQAINLMVPLSQKGAAGGVASLDSGGKVPASQLPSFVDDVLEFPSLANFPGTGEAGKLYVAVDTDQVYRWSGSTYVQITASPGSTDSVPEGSTNLYYTDARARTATLTQSITSGDTTHAPSGDAVFKALAPKAPLASPALTGTPTAPTASTSTNTTQIATTAFVQANQALDLKAASNLSDLANAATARGNLGLGSMATQNANAVAITGGSIDGVTMDGGTY